MIIGSSPTFFKLLTADFLGLVGMNINLINSIMKTLRFIGIALLTVLMSVAISSCSKSDDDNNGGGGSSVSIEGTWIE